MSRDNRFLRWVLGIGALVVLLALITLGAVIGWFAARISGAGSPSPTIASTPTLIRQVQGLNQLVSVKYVLEKVVIVEDAKWYGDSRLLMVAHGVAKAGVDLSKLRDEDIRIRGTAARITLPRPLILDVYLDERRTQVVERTTGLLRDFDKDLEQDARRQAVDQMKLAVRDTGILKDAEERARLQVRGLFGRMGFTEVEVEFR